MGLSNLKKKMMVTRYTVCLKLCSTHKITHQKHQSWLGKQTKQKAYIFYFIFYWWGSFDLKYPHVCVSSWHFVCHMSHHTTQHHVAICRIPNNEGIGMGMRSGTTHGIVTRNRHPLLRSPLPQYHPSSRQCTHTSHSNFTIPQSHCHINHSNL